MHAPRKSVFHVASIALILGLCWSVPRIADGKQEKEEIPKPEDLVLDTADGLQLTVTYYPGLKGKDSIPIVLLHGFGQTRHDYKDLAPALQKLGHAVIVPDLRGHGDSTRIKGARPDETLDAQKMPPSQFSRMVMQDMQAVKEFLWKRNNSGELNIDKLCIVGADMGASVALDFALADAVLQDRNPVCQPSYKLGRFVKALVLISPERTFRGLPVREALAYPAVQRDIAFLILVGRQDPKALEEAERIHSQLRARRPEPTGPDKTDRQTLFLGKFKTRLQGDQLLDPKFKVEALVADFVNRRLVQSDESKEWRWHKRKLPHE